jgi:hypothetical protein
VKLFISLALLLLGTTVNACELSVGPGATVRLSEGKSGGLFSAGCTFKDKWELRLFYFGEQRIYEEQIVIDDYTALGVARVWTFRDGKKIRPYLGAGLMGKESQRCHFNGDIDCNRLTPLPFCFWAYAGIVLGDVTVSLHHCSNASLDEGPEKKNLGQDFVMAQLRF